MRIKALFITAVMSVAVISGICKGLSSPRDRAKKQGEDKTGEDKAGEDKETPAQKTDLK